MYVIVGEKKIRDMKRYKKFSHKRILSAGFHLNFGKKK